MKTSYKTLAALVLTIILFTGTRGYSQEIKPLTVGDKMPDILLQSVLNYRKSSAKISDFKDKAIILDFWFIACGSCREAMPHLDSLQKVFKDDLQLMLVTWEDKKKVEDFFATDLNAKNLKFVNVVNDIILRKMFPASGFPHQVWIDKNNRIAAITDGTTTSVENIRKLINSNKLDLPVKVDETDRDLAVGKDPLITYRYETTKDKILKYSYLSKARSEFNGGGSYRVDSINKMARVNLRNIGFLRLYDAAYSTSPFGSDGLHYKHRIIRKDTISMRSEADYKTHTNVFCYDLIYPYTGGYGDFGKYMRRDLDEYFGLKSHEETIKMNCLVIKEKKGVEKAYLRMMDGNERKFMDARLVVGQKFRVNRIWKQSINTVLNYNDRIPIIIELDCGQYQPLSFSFVWNPEDVKAMSGELNKFGLEMVMQKRPRKMVILENK